MKTLLTLLTLAVAVCTGNSQTTLQNDTGASVSVYATGVNDGSSFNFSWENISPGASVYLDGDALFGDGGIFLESMGLEVFSPGGDATLFANGPLAGGTLSLDGVLDDGGGNYADWTSALASAPYSVPEPSTSFFFAMSLVIGWWMRCGKSPGTTTSMQPVSVSGSC